MCAAGASVQDGGLEKKKAPWRSRELLRPGEVAEIIGESRSGVYSRIARGHIPAVRLGKSVRVPRVLLEELIAGLKPRRTSP